MKTKTLLDAAIEAATADVKRAENKRAEALRKADEASGALRLCRRRLEDMRQGKWTEGALRQFIAGRL